MKELDWHGGHGRRVTNWCNPFTGPPYFLAIECKVRNEITNRQRNAKSTRPYRVEARSNLGVFGTENLRRLYKRRSLANGNNEPPSGHATTYNKATRGVTNAVAWCRQQ